MARAAVKRVFFIFYNLVGIMCWGVVSFDTIDSFDSSVNNDNSVNNARTDKHLFLVYTHIVPCNEGESEGCKDCRTDITEELVAGIDKH